MAGEDALVLCHIRPGFRVKRSDSDLIVNLLDHLAGCVYGRPSPRTPFLPRSPPLMDRKWWTLTAVSVGVFMLLLDVTIVNVALPDIQAAFGASLSDLQWVIDAYALTLAALLLTAGSLADLYGRRRVFALGIVIFTLGSLLCGIATSPLWLTLARAFQGIGGAIMFSTSLALISNAFRAGDRG